MTPLIAAGLAGLVAILVTLAIEGFGGRLGGLLGTLPTPIVPSAWRPTTPRWSARP